MKRVGALFERIVERENLMLAFYRAARGKKYRSEVRDFDRRLLEWVEDLPHRLFDRRVEFGRFQQFMIRDPKLRVITAPCFEERVLHHAIMNVCEPFFECWLIDDTFACRVGRGREAALRRASYFNRAPIWCLKMDVRKFFDRIPHSNLLGLLARRFKDPRLAELFREIVQSFRSKVGYGLPIGSLMSQHFANFYLGWLDRFIKESLRVKGYVRYMDDMLLWGSSRQSLVQIQRHCESFVEKELGLVFKTSQIRRANQGINFLGCRLFESHIELNRRSKLRWLRRTRFLDKAYKFGLLSELDMQRRQTSLASFARSGGVRSWKFRNAVLEQRKVDEP